MQMAAQLGLFFNLVYFFYYNNYDLDYILSRLNKIDYELKLPQRGNLQCHLQRALDIYNVPSWIKDFSGMVTFSISR